MDNAIESIKRACSPEQLKAMSLNIQDLASSHLRLILYSILGIAVSIWAFAALARRPAPTTKTAAPPQPADVEKRGPFAETATRAKFAMAEPGGTSPC